MTGFGEGDNKHIHTEKLMCMPLKTQWETLIDDEKTRKVKKCPNKALWDKTSPTKPLNSCVLTICCSALSLP